MEKENTANKLILSKPIFWYSLVIDLIIVDQLTKYAIREWFDLPITLVPDWLSIVFVENTGIAFSLPVPGGLSGLIALVVSLYLATEIWRKQLSSTVKTAYVMIMAGAIGNLIDRLWHGAVTDFISVSTFPVFNVADSLICVGVVLIIWHEVTSG